MKDYAHGYLRKLPDGFNKTNYYGFTLKKNFLYGKTDDGAPIACSLDEHKGKYYLYELTDTGWQQKEIGIMDLISMTCAV